MRGWIRSVISSKHPRMPHVTIALCLEYPLAQRGGVSVLAEELIRQLAPHYRVVLVSGDLPGTLETHPLRSLFAAHLTWQAERASFETSRQLAEQLRGLHVQLAHFHLGGVYGWGLRVPGQAPFGYVARMGIAVCTTVHLTVSLLDGYCGPEKPLWFKLALLPFAWFAKILAVASVRTEIAVSQHDLRFLRRWYAPAAKRYRQIYHSRLTATAPMPVRERRPVVLNVGHLSPRKGQLVLAQAFLSIAARYPDWELQLAGPDADGATTTQILALARESGMGSRVRLLGSREDVLDLMAECGIYVQPSSAEALGLALQEALFVGCPAIGTTAGGIPELIEDGQNGLLVPSNDVAALASALERLINDSSLRAKFSAEARPSIIARGMTTEAMTAQHIALYDELLAASPANS